MEYEKKILCWIAVLAGLMVGGLVVMAVVGERERELVVVRDCFGECGISQRWEEIAMEFKVETAEWKDKTRRLQTERIEYERFLRVVEPIALTNETFNKEHDYE